MPILISLALLNKELHVGREEANLLPLDGHELREMEESCIRQANGHQLHHRVERAGRGEEPQIEKASDVRSKQRPLNARPRDARALSNFPTHSDESVLRRRLKASNGVMQEDCR